jgi:hypothetical protein
VTAIDIVQRLRHHGIRPSLRANRIAVDASVPPPERVRRVLRDHRAALIDALRGRDREIDMGIPARTLDEIGAFKLRGVWTHDLGDQVLWDLFLGFTTGDELAEAHREKLARARRMLAGAARRVANDRGEVR